jgi:tight adherence protein B
MAVAVVTFILVVALVFGSYWLLVVRPEEREHGTLSRRLRQPQRREAAARLGLERQAEKLSAIRPLAVLLKNADRVAGPLQASIDQAGLTITVGTLVLACACVALLVLVVTAQLTGLFLLGLALGALAGMLPLQWVRWKRARRLLQFEEQFPEAIDLIARAMRAGHGFTTGLAMVAEEIPDPIGAEFRVLHDRQNFGQPLPDALREFAGRVPLLDARFFATAVLTQRESGGNLAEVLDNLAGVIRERFKVKRQVRVISAHGRMTGWILMALPPALALAFIVVAPDNMRMLVNDPLGIRMVVGAIVLQITGSLVIRRLVDIEY